MYSSRVFRSHLQSNSLSQQCARNLGKSSTLANVTRAHTTGEIWLKTKRKFSSLLVLSRWPNGLASQRKFSTCVSFGHPLACDDLHWLWSSSKSYASRRKFFTVWPPNTSRLQVDWKLTVYAWKVITFCDFRELVIRLANPFGHPSQVRTQVLVLQTCVDWRVSLARALIFFLLKFSSRRINLYWNWVCKHFAATGWKTI